MKSYTTGNWVEGTEFWGRENEINLLKDRIRSSASLLIQAPRRMGKTSLIHELSRQIKDICTCIHIDMQNCDNLLSICDKFVEDINKYIKLKSSTVSKLKSILSKCFESISEIKTNNMEISFTHNRNIDTFKSIMDNLFAELVEYGKIKPVVLFIDEMPQPIENILENEVDGKRQVTFMLSYLRLKLQENQGRIQAVFAGSIGFEPILNEINQTHQINHLERFSLIGWKNDEAVEFLLYMSSQNNIELSITNAQLLIDNLGDTVPYHVQLTYAEMLQKCHSYKKNKVDENIINEIFIDPNFITKFLDYENMETRLKRRLKGKDLAFAHGILLECADRGYVGKKDLKSLIENHGFDPYKDIVTIKSILYMLIHDWYIKYDSQKRLEFATPMLKKWWNVHYESLPSMDLLDGSEEENENFGLSPEQVA